MSPPLRPAEAAVCAYHDDLMETMRRIETKQDSTLEKVAGLDKALGEHIAIHKERERTAFPWGKVAVEVAKWIAIVAIVLMVLQAGEHWGPLKAFFGP